MEYNGIYCMKRWQYMIDIHTNDALVLPFVVSHSIMMLAQHYISVVYGKL